MMLECEKRLAFGMLGKSLNLFGIQQQLSISAGTLMIPVFVAIAGLLFIIRGMGLDIPYLSPAPATAMVDAAAGCH